MTNPIKLTDELLDELFHNLCGQHERCEAMVAAVRAMRDRARAVCYDQITYFDGFDVRVDRQSLDALREVLP